jgi:uncharacterized protein YqfB (UPF0267 family)
MQLLIYYTKKISFADATAGHARQQAIGVPGLFNIITEILKKYSDKS